MGPRRPGGSAAPESSAQGQSWRPLDENGGLPYGMQKLEDQRAIRLLDVDRIIAAAVINNHSEVGQLDPIVGVLPDDKRVRAGDIHARTALVSLVSSNARNHCSTVRPMSCFAMFSRPNAEDRFKAVRERTNWRITASHSPSSTHSPTSSAANLRYSEVGEERNGVPAAAIASPVAVERDSAK